MQHTQHSLLGNFSIRIVCYLIFTTLGCLTPLSGRASEFHLFILAGQSNMAGRGAIEPEDMETDQRILALDDHGAWKPAVDPLHFDKPQAGVGLGRSFARQYAQAHPGVTIGLIPCAVGGSPIDTWEPGAYHAQTQTHPYDDMLARVLPAMQQGELRGILWHQGESDSSAENAPLYEGKLRALIARMRDDLQSPTTPFLIGQLGDFPTKPWAEFRQHVDSVHQSIQLDTAAVQFVSSVALEDKGDSTHFDSPSYREFGRRYYAAYESLAKRSPRLLLPPQPNNPRNSEGDFIRLNDGRYLYLYTRFTGGASDHASADIVSRVSYDDGETWSTRDLLVIANDAAMNVMSVSLLRMKDGRIALFYMRKNSLEDCRPVVCFSSDEALSWSPPHEIISVQQQGYYVLNNDRVLQLDSGRLLVPVALHNRPGQEKPDWAGEVTLYYSDDQGANWHQSATTQKAFSPAGTRVWAQEPGIVLLDDGRLMMWVRTDAGQQYHCFSNDEGEHWDTLVPMNLASPRSPASIERIPGSGDLLAVWNDHSHLSNSARTLRTPLTYAISKDDGLSWSRPVLLESDPNGWFCYTAIDFHENHVLLGYVAGEQRADQHLATTKIVRRSIPNLYAAAGLARIESHQRIWAEATHNAFTDLIRFRDEWLCVFREGSAHVSDDGALRIIASSNGIDWSSAARIESDQADLRDAKITLCPDGRLMLSGAGAYPPGSGFKHQSLSWFSEDGRHWDGPYEIGDRDFWLWRTTWNDNVAWSVGYRTNDPADRFARLYRSGDGKVFETVVDRLFEQGYPNETSMHFTETGKCYCLLRRDGTPSNGLIGIASPPYEQWDWKDLGIKIGGPHMIRLPDRRYVAAVRLYDHSVRTSLCWLDPERGTLDEFLTLPSGGDTSYAGLVYHDDRLYVSYYSAHEAQKEPFQTAIYFCRVALPEAYAAERKELTIPDAADAESLQP